MARPNEFGLSYYNSDVDRYSDIKIRRLKKSLGCTGIAVYDYILALIYSKGCVLEWDENTTLDVSDYFNLKETTVVEVVNYCCKVGLFNKELHASESILTSQQIQERYVFICKKAKLKYHIPKNANLIQKEESAPSTEDLPHSTEESAKSTEDSEQRKEKERKEKEIISIIKEEDNKGNPKIEVPPPPPSNSLSPFSEQLELIDVDVCKVRYFSKEYEKSKEEILKHYFHQQITEAKLQYLAIAFASHLKKSGTPRKTMIDFVKHFSNWLNTATQKRSLNDLAIEGLNIYKSEQNENRNPPG